MVLCGLVLINSRETTSEKWGTSSDAMTFHLFLLLVFGVESSLMASVFPCRRNLGPGKDLCTIVPTPMHACMHMLYMCVSIYLHMYLNCALIVGYSVYVIVRPYVHA